MGKRAWWSVAGVVISIGLLGSGLAAAEPGGSQWPSAGQNIENTRYQSTETKIGVGNVAQLGVKWVFTTQGDVSATPAVDGTKVYVPDWKGNLYAVDRATGNGTVFWGSGYSNFGFGTPNNQLYAFDLP